MPQDRKLLGLLEHWVPDARMRKRILVDNPATLYGFQGQSNP
jgi:predicted TIM-barrel fold metal-dependent hydrolase